MPDFVLKNQYYFTKFKAEFKKALTCQSGPQGVFFDEKTEGRKYHDTIPLKMIQLRNFDNLNADYPASRQSGTGLKKN
jgi:hypothetical protein